MLAAYLDIGASLLIEGSDLIVKADMKGLRLETLIELDKSHAASSSASPHGADPGASSVSSCTFSSQSCRERRFRKWSTFMLCTRESLSHTTEDNCGYDRDRVQQHVCLCWTI